MANRVKRCLGLSNNIRLLHIQQMASQTAATMDSSLHLIDLPVEYGTVTVVGRMMRHLATMLTTRGTPQNTRALQTTMTDSE